MTKPRIAQLHQSGATDGQFVRWDGTAGYWEPQSVVESAILAFSYQGALTVTTGVSQLPMDQTWTIASVVARVSTAPTGASILVDVNKNGTTIFTTQANRPAIAATTNASSVVTNMNVTSLTAGDYLSIDVDQIGSTIAGSDLVVAVRLIRGFA